MKIHKKVLVVATSSSTRGGITAVINAHQKSSFWEKWNCTWIETHIDKSILHKIVFFLFAFLKYLYFLASSSLVHIHLSGPVSAIRKYIFLVIAKIFKKPIIIHFHAFSSKSSIPKSHKNLYKIIFGMADKIIVLSDNWRRGLIKDFKYNSEKVNVIQNPCPIIDKKNKTASKKIILYAGTLNPRKGYLDLIRSFSKIAIDYSDWKLVLAGNGEIQKGKNLAKKLNILDQVVFTGWISGEVKHEVFSEASIFCLPSYAEGFPMAVLDAWAYHLPVISTPVGGIPDVAIDGDNILLCNPGDIDCLEKSIRCIIEDKQLHKKLINASKEFSKGLFSIAEISLKWDELYCDLHNK